MRKSEIISKNKEYEKGNIPPEMGMVRNGSNFMQRLGRCTILKVDELVLGRTELCVPPEKRIQRSGMNHGQWPWRCAESKVDELVNGDEQWFIPPDSGIKHWALFG